MHVARPSRRRFIRPGFTLVELLVVIGIIAVLIAILMPALRRAREQALKVECMSNQRQIVLASFMYAHDNRQQFPNVDGSWLYRVKGGPNKPTGIGQLVANGYIKTSNGRVIYCPTGDPKYNWCFPSHTIKQLTTNLSDNPTAFITYVGKFCTDQSWNDPSLGPAGAVRANLYLTGKQSAARFAPILVVDRVWEGDNIRMGSISGNDKGSPPHHDGKGLVAAFHDGSVRWIDADDVYLISGKTKRWGTLHPSNSFWHWAKKEFGKK